MRIEQHMLLLAVALASCITIQHEKETGASPDQGERTDTGADSATEDGETGETEDLDTDLSVDTAQSCENVVVDVALDDDSLGFADLGVAHHGVDLTWRPGDRDELLARDRPHDGDGRCRRGRRQAGGRGEGRMNGRGSWQSRERAVRSLSARRAPS